MNDDKLYNKIKEAAQNSEKQDFPAMDKVWNRVDEKLNASVLQKQNSQWKNIAVAASVLLVVALGFILNRNEAPPMEIREQVVAVDTMSMQQIDTTTQLVELENKLIKEDAPEILRKQLKAVSAVAIQETVAQEVEISATKDVQITENQNRVSNKIVSIKASHYEARGVQQSGESFVADEQQVVRKPNPLLIVDGQAVKEGRNYQKSLDAAMKKADNGDDEILVLTEPLYIINGTQYSEEEMFGENPTSPYAPLTKQEIETLTILQGEKATSIYGDKGRNGVVLITTKGGKPAAASSR